MSDVPQKVLELIDTYHRNRDDYRSPAFKEAMLRKQFVDPLFKCLGWDVDNERGHAEAYKEVVHEASLKIDGKTKAPDYCFRVGGTPKFYLESKKPAENVKGDAEHAHQLRSYGWSRKLSICILTSFEEFAVYDCRYEPKKSDSASVARIDYFRYEDYPKKWPELDSLFSKDAILKGSFDRYAESNRAKRGTATVDVAFLAEIESWRLDLAKNVALRNAEIGQRELNYAVQMTIDRIVFLRMCEDRGIEKYGQLRDLTDDDGIYTELCKLFRKADARYNSGLFHFDKEKGRTEDHDSLTTTLSIDDKVLKGILKNLYYPQCSYVFSVLPADILGQVYEQFLGKVIRLTDGHQAKVEDKPEVKKAGGVYYTPTYIVDYIVANTVGKLLEGKTPNEAAKLTVLDPACGSGSFLLGAYESLLKWHLDYYSTRKPTTHKKEIFPDESGGWKLTTAERKRILLNNIYGVDIDPQAVEVTKLSLLLKVLEGESQETLESQRKMFHERALPDLASNIKCGNSLIGPDFYTNQTGVLFDEEERYRINVFDWNKGFPAIMKAGGFDAVIGNPPYGAFFGIEESAYLRSKYECPANSLDSFILFVENSSLVLRTESILGFIIPSGWVSAPSSKPLRQMFTTRFTPLTFVTLPFGVFHDAYIDTVIIIAKKSGTKSTSTKDKVKLVVFPQKYRIHSVNEFDDFCKNGRFRQWAKTKNQEYLITCSDKEVDLLLKIQSQRQRLADFVVVKRGIETYVPTNSKSTLNKPMKAFTGVLQRYNLRHGEAGYLSYDDKIQESKPLAFFKGSRLLLRQVLSRKLRLQAVMASETFLTNQSVQSLVPIPGSIVPNILHALLGIVNSKLLSWYFRSINSVARRDDFPKIVIAQTRDLPIAEFSGQLPKFNKMSELAIHMNALFEHFAKAKTPHEKTVLKTQIDATDTAIDQLVYELYGLTDDEIKIVEAATQQ